MILCQALKCKYRNLNFPIFVKLKELAVSGDLGRINYIYSNRLNWSKIRREENTLWSFAPHDISMILSLASGYPENVLTTGGDYLHQKIADVTTTHLEFPSGLKAHIFVSWLHPFKEQKLVVVGDKKMAVFDDTRPWEEKLLLFPHQINWEHNAPITVKADAKRLEIPQAEPMLLECEHFLQSMVTGQALRTDGAQGLRVLKILNASQESLDTNGKKIYFKEHTEKSQSVSDLTFYAHPTAIIDKNSTIGAATKIWHFSKVMAGARIGKNCTIGQNVVIERDVSIGANCKIQNNVSVYKGVTLEDGVFCGPSMVFTNVCNPRAKIAKMNQV